MRGDLTGLVALSDSERRLGEWNRAQRTISISRRLVVQQPWGVVREVLKHEMAHQYVFEILGRIAEKHLGQRIVVENKPGVSGTMGAQALAQGAKPDGYTIAQMPITVFRLPHMMKTNFDPLQDFTWIIHLTGYTFGVVVRSESPWKTWGR
jgi:hypothetical protein